MKFLKKLKSYSFLFGITLLFGTLLFTSVPGVHVLAAPTVNIISPSNGAYFTQGTTLHIRAYVSGNPTSVTAQYLCRNGYSDNTYVEYTLGSLTRDGATNYWVLDYNVNFVCLPRLANYAPNLSIVSPKIQVTATDGGGTTKKTVDATICMQNVSFYNSYDSTFFYANEYANPFWICGTGRDYVPVSWTYNCMAYALGLSNNGWLWPWAGNPTYAQVSSVLQAAPYYYTQCQQTPFSGAQVIYYSGGHFSKVWVWDISGLPSQIRSKWGGLELISSLSGNPFSGGSYGSASGYFKK